MEALKWNTRVLFFLCGKKGNKTDGEMIYKRSVVSCRHVTDRDRTGHSALLAKWMWSGTSDDVMCVP